MRRRNEPPQAITPTPTKQVELRRLEVIVSDEDYRLLNKIADDFGYGTGRVAAFLPDVVFCLTRSDEILGLLDRTFPEVRARWQQGKLGRLSEWGIEAELKPLRPFLKKHESPKLEKLRKEIWKSHILERREARLKARREGRP